MKRNLLVSVLVAFGISFTATQAFSEDLPVADIDVVMDFKQFCEDIAEEEGTDGMALPEFLLQCVNDELEAEGYQTVTSLPQ
ncbi:hypothetical protein ACFO4O_10700 [Glaciecola siphonariae]|uniref:Secreted protein n=1 Tax=Glaciecola siphonariae TaxID=521012 RepID=A0ABV9LYC3_9ALTE